MLSWLSNPVLLEWDQSIRWCDRVATRDYEALRRLMRGVALRAVPVGAALFALGFWLIGQIPGGTPVPAPLQLAIAATMLAVWPLLYAALRLGVGRPTGGTSVRAKLRARGLQLVQPNGRVRSVPWSNFDVFDFVDWSGFDLVRLRLRGNWLSRRLAPRQVLALEHGAAPVGASAIREVLRGRGLREEPMGGLGAETGELR